MKKHLLKINLFIFLLSVLLGCRKEEHPLVENELTTLKTFYAQKKPNDGNIFKNTSPIWNRMIHLKDENFNVYEIPLQNPSKIGTTSKELTSDDILDYDKKHALRLLLFVDVTSGKVAKAYYMTIETIKETSLDKINYKNFNELDGYVMYYEWDGSLSNGTVYLAGKPSGVIKGLSKDDAVMLREQNRDSRSVQGDCTNFLIETGYVYCVYTPFSDHCGWESLGYASYTLCSGGSGEGGGGRGPGAGSGGGGGSTGSTNLLEPLQAYNKLCASSFNFSTVVVPADGSRGWKEASVSGLTINVMASNYFENIWNMVTTGSGSTVGTFNLTIGVPGDLPSSNVANDASFAINKAMIDIYRSYGADGVKNLINMGTIGSKIASLAQIQLASAIPGARVSSSLSNRVTPTTPVIGINCR